MNLRIQKLTSILALCVLALCLVTTPTQANILFTKEDEGYVNKLKEETKSYFHGAQSRLKSAEAKIRDFLSSTGNTASKSAGSVLPDTDTLQYHTDKLLLDAWHTQKQVEKEVNAKLASAGQTISDTADAVAPDAEAWKAEAQSYWQKAQAKLHAVEAELQGYITSTGKYVANKGGDAAESAGDGLEILRQEAMKRGEVLRVATMANLAAAGNLAGKKAGEAGEYVGEKASEAGDVAYEQGIKAKDAAAENLQAAGEYASIKGQEAANAAYDQAAVAGEYLGEKASEAGDVAYEQGIKAKDAAVENAQVAGEYASEKAKEAADAAYVKGEELSAEAMAQAQVAKDAAAANAAAGGEYVGQKAKELKDAAYVKGQEAAQEASIQGEAAKNAAAAGAASAAAGMADAAGYVGQKAKEGAAAAAQKASELTGEALVQAEKAAGLASQKANEAAAAAQAQAEAAAQKASELTGEAKVQAEQAATAASQKASELAQEAKVQTEKAGALASQKASEAANAAQANAANAGEYVNEQARAAAAEANAQGQKAQAQAGGAVAGLKSKTMKLINDAWNKEQAIQGALTASLLSAGDALRRTIVSSAPDTDKLQADAENAARDAKDSVANAANSAKQSADNAAAQAQAQMADAAGTVQSNAKAAKDSAVNAATNAKDAAANTAQNAKDSVADAANEAYKQAPSSSSLRAETEKLINEAWKKKEGAKEGAKDQFAKMQAAGGKLTDVDAMKEFLFPNAGKTVYSVKTTEADGEHSNDWTAKQISEHRFKNRNDPSVDDKILIKNKEGKYVGVSDGLDSDDLLYFLASYAHNTMEDTGDEEEGDAGVVDLFNRGLQGIIDSDPIDADVYYDVHCIRSCQRTLKKLSLGQGKLKDYSVAAVGSPEVDRIKALKDWNDKDTLRRMYISFEPHAQDKANEEIPANPIYEAVFRVREYTRPDVLLMWAVNEKRERVADITAMLKQKSSVLDAVSPLAWYESGESAVTFYWAMAKVGLAQIYHEPSIIVNTFTHIFSGLVPGSERPEL